MTRYRALLAYVGTRFRGWQRQAGDARTVQAVLEEVLEGIDGARVVCVAAGRTDAGVHADGQVVHFDLVRVASAVSIRERANLVLPWDARLLEVAPAPADFHARRDAVWKRYVYRWSRAEVIAPRASLFVAPISRAPTPPAWPRRRGPCRARGTSASLASDCRTASPRCDA